MFFELSLIFLAGLLTDFLFTKYARYISKRKVVGATLLSGIITVVNFGLLVVILRGDSERSFINIVVFAIGNSLGTFIALNKKKKVKKSKMQKGGKNEKI